jgi:hypothetical protein
MVFPEKSDLKKVKGSAGAGSEEGKDGGGLQAFMIWSVKL